jgi:exosome complex exonuclease RRP6
MPINSTSLLTGGFGLWLRVWPSCVISVIALNADFPCRPLPEEMFNYARSDTHFLLYIFDCIRNELLEKSNLEEPENKMALVLKNSAEVSLRLYERELYDAAGGDGTLGWRNLLGRSQEGLNPMQVSVFKAVHQWRDTTARIEDESVNFVMPRHSLFNLARKMPVDIAGVLACCPRPSPPVKNRAGELVVIIKKAKDTPEVREWKKAIAAQAEEAAKAAQSEVPAEETAIQEGPRMEVFTAAKSQIATLRSEKSGFWGNCDDSSQWRTESPEQEGLRLAVPLPQLTAEVFASSSFEAATVEEAVDPGARAEHEYVKNRPVKKVESDVIVVRSLGGGRKRKLPDSDEANEDKEEATSESSAAVEAVNNGDVSTEQQEQGLSTQDGGRRREKSKSRKKKKGADAVDEEKTPAVPFDYASAPPVLNQKRDDGAKGRKEKKKKPFNPYAGSGNAPKGLSRKNQERAGRTSTFKR